MNCVGAGEGGKNVTKIYCMKKKKPWLSQLQPFPTWWYQFLSYFSSVAVVINLLKEVWWRKSLFDLQVQSITEGSQRRTQVSNLEAGTESDYGGTLLIVLFPLFCSATIVT